MESKASQIGELLVLNKGNWSGGIPSVVGLAENWPVLNRTKISWLNSSCNNTYANYNYANLSKNLGISPVNRLKIMVKETKPDKTVSDLVDCPPGKMVNARKAETKRYALVSDASNPSAMNVASVFIYIW
jgi:hypothetical protein